MKKVLLGITGSIAAYKTAELVRLMKKQGIEVKVVMTASASEFITPMTLQVLSQNEVRCDIFNHQDEAKIDHISLARWADQIILAPLSANTLAKIANGFADDLLTTICLATNCPIAIAPAMNQAMWANTFTQQNLTKLTDNGYQLIMPDSGEQACGEIGVGRMAEPTTIINTLFSQQLTLKDKKLLITAGPTIERIDPVRFMSNDSSGKMGYALAHEALALGANVTLISGKVALSAHPNINLIKVESAQQMYDAVMAEVSDCDWFIATAAVADFKIAQPSPKKIKKSGNDNLVIELTPNPDILQSVCALKNKPLTIGFAAETENLIEYASQKKLKKGADFICANDVSNPSIGFNSQQNAITLIGDDYQQQFPLNDKSLLAKQLLITINQLQDK